MTDDEMLDQLAAEGENAGSDYNDNEKVLGWFGWELDQADDILTISYQKDDGTNQHEQWRLVKL
jgi:hypothetical protein